MIRIKTLLSFFSIYEYGYTIGSLDKKVKARRNKFTGEIFVWYFNRLFHYWCWAEATDLAKKNFKKSPGYWPGLS